MADKASREKKAHRLFMQRSLAAYNNMRARMGKQIHGKESKIKSDLPFTLDQLRHEVRNSIDWGACPYLGEREFGEPVTAKNFSVDHRQPVSRGGDYRLENLIICSERGNLAKGNLDEKEFHSLVTMISSWPAEARKDLIGRLRAASASRHRVFFKKRIGGSAQ